jgi:hypothetical protein
MWDLRKEKWEETAFAHVVEQKMKINCTYSAARMNECNKRYAIALL